MKMTLLISGGLGANILKYCIDEGYTLNSVFTNSASTIIIECCNRNDIPCYIGNPRYHKADDFIEQVDCDLLLSVNYLYIIKDNLISKAKKIAINIHGSLLPKYRGRTPHVWAIINNETETGVTAHEIVKGLDAGNILFQKKVQINFNDTGNDVLKKYVPVYMQMVKRIVEVTMNDELKLVPQNEDLATYFGKRTPEDGKIVFEWSKERIRNWIRAQAHPYPGAYFYYNGNKLTVHKATFSTYGYSQGDKNGTILSVGNNSIIIKTPNGAIEFSNIENFASNYFQINDLVI